MADFQNAVESQPVSQVVQDPLEAGRDALRRRDWAEGYELLLSADESRELDPEDVMLLGEAAMWTGHMDAVEPYFERAYRGYLQAGKTLRAAFVATWLAHNLKNNLQMSLANGWMSRAKRLLEQNTSPLVVTRLCNNRRKISQRHCLPACFLHVIGRQ